MCPIHGSNADVLWNPNNPTASLPNAGIFCRLFGYSQSKIFTLRMPQWDLPRFPDYKKGGNISNKIMIQHSNSLKHSFYCWRYFQIGCIFNGSMVHRVNKSWFMTIHELEVDAACMFIFFRPSPASYCAIGVAAAEPMISLFAENKSDSPFG